MADFFWSDESDRQYGKHRSDPPVQQTFRDLIRLIDERPDAGWSILELVESMDDPVARRIATAIASTRLPHPARIVVATIPRPRGAMPPPWLAVVIHVRGAPPGVAATHTLLTMGTISRSPGATLR